VAAIQEWPWGFEEQREGMVTVAATIDGGELAWKLTQISACDKRNLNPL
jgi:hypothetical protein